ncbi:MAG: DUF4126 family protein [Candidatus Krumholzibacteriia bacterium]
MKRAKTTTLVARAAAVGAVAGMRSMSPPAMVGRRLARHALGRSRAEWMSSRRTGRVLALMAAGEIVADKMPGIPSRTYPPALAMRAMTGAATAAALARASGGHRWHGALAGAAGAVAGAHVARRLREGAVRRTGWSDRAVGVIEDAAALGLGWLVCRRR